MLDDFESIVVEMKEKASIQRGRAIVASVPSIASNALPNIIAAFKNEHAGIAVQVCDERTEVIEERVRRGEADFAISPPTERNSELEFEHIVHDAYFAVFPRNHELAQSRPISLKRFATYPLVLMRPEQNMRHVLDEAAKRTGVSLRPVHEVYHHDTLTGMVAAGLGIGALPRLTISIIRDPRLTMARITEPRIARSIGILKRRGEPLQPAAQTLMNATRSYLLAAIKVPDIGRDIGRLRKR
jgi:DNA-binding transcriptional LysR family regulator